MSEAEKERRGGELVTRWEAERIVTTMLEEYERKVIAPRHKETQDDLLEVKKTTSETRDLLSEGRGMKRLASVLLSAAGGLWLIVQIIHALSGHPITLGGV